MTVPRMRHPCESRLQVTVLENDQYLVGRVATQPLSADSSSLGDDAFGHSSVPLYLENMGAGQYCAYPIHTNPFLLHSPFGSEDLFPENSRNLPNLFGKPTRLRQTPDTNLADTIYDPERQLFYAPDVEGLRWYLVGNETNHRSFWSAVDLQIDRFHRTFSASPMALFENSLSLSSEDGASSPLLITLPELSLARFATWLKHADPELYAKVDGVLDYTLTGPDESCANPYTEDAYAYYEPRKDRIFLMPRSFQQLENGDYEAVAETLAHEVKHRENASQGLTTPSFEIMSRSLSYFFHDLQRGYPLTSFFLRDLQPYFTDKIICTQLPLLPEEELSAFGEEFHYAEGDHMDHAERFAPARREALDYIDGISDYLFENFSVPWSYLALQYVHLANAKPAANRKQTEIQGLFLQHLQDRFACNLSATGCQEPSGARQSLDRMLAPRDNLLP